MTAEEKRAYHRQWQRENKDKVKAYNASYRAKKKHPEKFGVWIRVDERLPDEPGTYIVYALGLGTRTAFFAGKEFPSLVTHWMAFPDPPEM